MSPRPAEAASDLSSNVRGCPLWFGTSKPGKVRAREQAGGYPRRCLTLRLILVRLSDPKAKPLEPRNPPGDILTVPRVGGTENPAQGGFFIQDNEQMGTDCYDDRAGQQRARGMPERVPQEDRDYSQVDRVANVSVQPADDQFFRGVSWGGGTVAAYGEGPGAPQQPEYPCRPEWDCQPPENTERKQRSVRPNQPDGQSPHHGPRYEHQEEDGLDGGLQFSRSPPPSLCCSRARRLVEGLLHLSEAECPKELLPCGRKPTASQTDRLVAPPGVWGRPPGRIVRGVVPSGLASPDPG